MRIHLRIFMDTFKSHDIYYKRSLYLIVRSILQIIEYDRSNPKPVLSRGYEYFFAPSLWYDHLS